MFIRTEVTTLLNQGLQTSSSRPQNRDDDDDLNDSFLPKTVDKENVFCMVDIHEGFSWEPGLRRARIHRKHAAADGVSWLAVYILNFTHVEF